MSCSRPRWLLGRAALLCVLGCGPAKPVTVEVPPVHPKHAEWSLALSAAGDVTVSSVVAARDGSLFVAGEYAGELAIHGQRIASLGKTDGFVAKISGSGRVTWLHGIGTTAIERVTALGLGRDNTLWVAGESGREGFVAKVAPRHGVTLRSTFRATEQLSVRALAVDAQGGAVVVGHFAGTLSVGRHQVTSAGVTDAFVARFDRGGVAQWLVRAGGIGADHAHAVAVQGDHIAVVGGFLWRAYFDRQLVESRGKSYDGYLASFDLRGRLRWVKPVGGDGRDSATAVAIGASGTIYFAGSFHGAASFGGAPLMATDGPDVFISAVTREGKTRWTKHIGGASPERANALVTRGDRAYLLGSFIGTTRAGDYTIRGDRKYDGFVATYTADGTLHGAKPVAGRGDESVRAIAIDREGAAIVTGSFLGPTTLIANQPLANDDQHTSGFVIRLSP